MWYKNIADRFFGLATNHACDRQTDGQTDGRTDRQNYNSQDCASIGRGKNRYALCLCGYRLFEILIVHFPKNADDISLSLHVTVRQYSRCRFFVRYGKITMTTFISCLLF